MCGHGREGSEVRGMELRPIRMYTSTVYVISVGEHVLVGNGWSGGLVLRACKFYIEGQLGVRELPLAALEQSPKLWKKKTHFCRWHPPRSVLSCWLLVMYED